MLQKPSAKSKARDNAKYLTRRLQRWKDGELNDILSEVREIQKRLKKMQKVKEESRSKAFCRLMFRGKVGQALRFIDSESGIKGVHKVNRQVKGLLKDKRNEKLEKRKILLTAVYNTEYNNNNIRIRTNPILLKTQ